MKEQHTHKKSQNKQKLSNKCAKLSNKKQQFLCTKNFIGGENCFLCSLSKQFFLKKIFGVPLKEITKFFNNFLSVRIYENLLLTCENALKIFFLIFRIFSYLWESFKIFFWSLKIYDHFLKSSFTCENLWKSFKITLYLLQN